jgi:uncharacterized protein (DUF1800 family)
MMIWLDIVQSKKERPNENFAREVMELFSLGEGHYTESDVKEAARAFTGYRINQPEQSFRFAARQFDPGSLELDDSRFFRANVHDAARANCRLLNSDDDREGSPYSGGSPTGWRKRRAEHDYSVGRRSLF